MKVMNSHHTPAPCREKSGDTLYKIGLFAAMNRVTVKALRFYEEQGLILPALIHPETGYRYYTLSQMSVLHQITALKQAGFTLEEIARINNGADGKSLLLKKKSELLLKIAELTKQAALVETFLSGDEARLTSPVLIKTIPEVTVACIRTRLDAYDALFEQMPAMGALMEEAGCTCARPEYCFTNYLETECPDAPEAPMDKRASERAPITAELCEAVTEAREASGALQFKTMPAITAACLYHKGPYSTLAASYEAVLTFIEENGYAIGGPIRESYIDGVWNKTDAAEWLTEIQIPIQKA